MARGKTDKRIANRTKLDIVIVLLSASTSHFDKVRNRISIEDVYRIIKLKNGFKSNRPIRDQIDLLVAQGIAEYVDNKRNVRIKATSGLAIKLFNLLEETPDEAFPYMSWEQEFLYRGAYQIAYISDMIKVAKKYFGNVGFDREGLFTRVFMTFSSVTKTIDSGSLDLKDLGREMVTHLMFLLAKEEALGEKLHEIPWGSQFLSNIISGSHVDKEEILTDEGGARATYTRYFKDEIKKFPGIWEILYNLFFPETEHQDIIQCLSKSPTALRTVMNYQSFPIEKLFKMSLFSVTNWQNMDGIIDEFIGPFYGSERKKVVIALRGMLGSTGYFQNNEIDRFCEPLEKDFNRKWYELNEDQDFQSVWLEISIKGVVRHNQFLNLTGHETKSPMLLSLQAYQQIDFINNPYIDRSPFDDRVFRSPQSVYAPYEIDKLINHGGKWSLSETN